MRYLFLAVRFFPLWAMPVAFAYSQLARFYLRRKKTKYDGYPSAFSAVLLVVLTIIWFANKGWRHSDDWVRAIVGLFD